MRDDIFQTKLEAPYIVYVFSEVFLSKGAFSTLNSIEPTSKVIYPVSFKEGYIGLLEVELEDGQILFAKFGDSKLAGELKKVEGYYTNKINIENKALVIHPSRKFEFVTFNFFLNELGEELLTPLNSAKRVMKNTLTNRQYSEMSIWQIQRFIKDKKALF